MRLDLVTPSQSLIELGACFVEWCMPPPPAKKKKNGVGIMWI